MTWILMVKFFAMLIDIIAMVHLYKQLKRQAAEIRGLQRSNDILQQEIGRLVRQQANLRFDHMTWLFNAAFGTNVKN